MLQSFEIEGFKSYDQATLVMTDPDRDREERSPLTVLVGANASRKTNLIEGLRLQSIAGGVRLDTIRPEPTDADLRGSLRGLVKVVLVDTSILLNVLHLDFALDRPETAAENSVVRARDVAHTLLQHPGSRADSKCSLRFMTSTPTDSIATRKPTS